MRKPSPTTVIALVALFVALGGPARAAKLISGSKIKPNTVTTKQVRNRTLTSSDIAPSTLQALKRRSRSVTSGTIVDGTIGLADMGGGSVTGNQVVDRSLSAVDLAPDTLTGGEIAPSAIGSAELASDSVLTVKVNNSAITKGKVHADAVGTSEVLDGSLTAADLGRTSGSVTATFTDVPAGGCAAQSFAGNGTTYSIPTGALAGAIVLVNSPADDVIVTGRAADANTLRIQVCNPTATAQTVSGDFPFVAIAP
ncbi:MAG: hypothetical protein QOI80_2057 [Solirubrobacteraceae bacterium]|jgi:hypothetical protein|nr:hypothetical protein [Solirubrobacteraceae bacterium]